MTPRIRSNEQWDATIARPAPKDHLPKESSPSARRPPVETVPRTTVGLTAAQSWLVEIMRKYQFGRIENLSVRAGQPLLDPSTKVVRVARLGRESGGTSVLSPDQFELKQEVRGLFEELARLQEGLIVRLEFRHGLPCLLETIASE